MPKLIKADVPERTEIPMEAQALEFAFKVSQDHCRSELSYWERALSDD